MIVEYDELPKWLLDDELPKWLLELWEISPRLAREAEKSLSKTVKVEGLYTGEIELNVN